MTSSRVSQGDEESFEDVGAVPGGHQFKLAAPDHHPLAVLDILTEDLADIHQLWYLRC